MCTFYVTKSIKRETKGNKAGIVRTTSNSNMPGLGYRNLPKFIIDITFCGRWRINERKVVAAFFYDDNVRFETAEMLMKSINKYRERNVELCYYY